MDILFNTPAREWEETLPIGNGSLGGMIFGTIKQEKIGLNDDRLWSGYDYDKHPPQAHKQWEKIKQFILDEQRLEAEALIEDSFLGNYSESYLPLGDLLIDYPTLSEEVSNYSRKLSVTDSISHVRIEGKEGIVEREYFASYPGKALYTRLKHSEPLDVHISFSSQLVHDVTLNPDGMSIHVTCPEHVDPHYIHHTSDPVIQGTRGEKHSYRLTILNTDGLLTTENKRLIIKGTTETTISFSRLADHKKRFYVEEKKKHVEDYKQLFNQVELDLGSQTDLSTPERLKKMREGEKDLGMVSLYFQYGRYLLISSSRPGSLPANLQGIWNWSMRPPWSSNYTLNINAEMNYWLADSCHLSECFEPYIKFIKELSIAGEETAKKQYGLSGFTCHHNSDKWGSTNPVGRTYGHELGDDGAVNWGMWQMGGAWLSSDLYRHYEYTNDVAYLKETVYPILRRSIIFLDGYLEEVDGVLHTIPSASPENEFYDWKGNICTIDKSTTMDITLVRENMLFFKRTCAILGIEDELLVRVDTILAKLPPVSLGSKGQILEWYEDFKEVDPGHRHVSHLYGLYPSELFEEDSLKEGVRQSIEERIKHGGGSTGWSNAWLVNLYAVLGEAEKAYEHIIDGIAYGSSDNLWSMHPPFQIDGNFGMTSGIANLFVQDRAGEVTLLPALPKALGKKGHIKGLKIKGNKMVNISWENGKITESEIIAL